MADITITHLPFKLIPINTGWNSVKFADGVLENSPTSLTIQCTTGTSVGIVKNSVPSSETNIVNLDATTVNKVVFTVRGNAGFHVKASGGTSDRLIIFE